MKLTLFSKCLKIHTDILWDKFEYAKKNIKMTALEELLTSLALLSSEQQSFVTRDK